MTATISEPEAPAEATEPTTKDIREWAVSQGMTVGVRGRLAASVVEAYKAAH